MRKNTRDFPVLSTLTEEKHASSDRRIRNYWFMLMWASRSTPSEARESCHKQ